MRLADIPPYTPTDWATERAAEKPTAPVPCPNCGHTEWYHPLRLNGTMARGVNTDVARCAAAGRKPMGVAGPTAAH